MNPLDTGTNVVIGAIISATISAAKKVPIIKAYPKITAAILAMAVTGLTAFLSDNPTHPVWGDLVLNVLTQLSTAVASHEVVTHTIQNNIDLGGGK